MLQFSEVKFQESKFLVSGNAVEMAQTDKKRLTVNVIFIKSGLWPFILPVIQTLRR